MLASRPSSQAWRERIQVWEQSNGVIIRRDAKDWRRTDRLVRDSCWSLFKGPLFVVPPAMSGVNGLVRVIDAKKERERLNWAPKQKYELPVVNSNFGGVTLFFLKRQTRCALRLFFFFSPFLPHLAITPTFPLPLSAPISTTYYSSLPHHLYPQHQPQLTTTSNSLFTQKHSDPVSSGRTDSHKPDHTHYKPTNLISNRTKSHNRVQCHTTPSLTLLV